MNRAVFDGKISRWLPMPKLENHSGFDRDSRTITREVTPIATPIAIPQPSQKDKLEAMYQSPSVPDVEVSTIEVVRPTAHPLQDKFDRIESLLEGEDSLLVRDVARAFNCKTDEAVQLSQMFCLAQKSRYQFTQTPNSNGTTSKAIQRL